MSDKTVRRSAVDQEDLKPSWKSEKRPRFSRGSTILLFKRFSITLLITERRLTGLQILPIVLSPIFLNIGTTNEIFQQSGKQDSLRHLLRSNGLVVQVLDFQANGCMLKTTGWLQGLLRLSFFPGQKMSTRNFWELSGKK